MAEPQEIPSFASYTPNKTEATGIPDFASYVPKLKNTEAKPLGVSMMGPSNQGKVPDDVINFLRPLIAGAGASGAAALSGPAAPITGPATYAGLDALLQHIQTKPPQGLISSGALNDSTKMEPGGVVSTLTNTAEQFGAGKILDKVVKGGVNAFKAFKNADQPEIMNLQPTTSQALKLTGRDKLAAVAKGFEDLNKRSKNQALDRTAGQGFSEALKVAKDNDLNFNRDPNIMLGQANRDMPLGPGSQTPIKITPGNAYQPAFKGKQFQAATPTSVQPGEPQLNQLADSFTKLDSVIRDPKKLQETLSRAQELGTGDNLKRTLGGYQFGKMFNDAMDTSSGKVRFDPAKLNTLMTDPEMQSSFGVLYNSNQRSNIQQFFKNVAATQDKLNASSFGTNSRRFTLIGGGAILGHALYSGSMAGAAGIGATTGMFLGAQQIGRLLANPRTARIMVALAGGEALGISEQMASRAISDALNGSTVALVNPDGSKQPVSIRDGRMEEVRQ